MGCIGVDKHSLENFEKDVKIQEERRFEGCELVEKSINININGSMDEINHLSAMLVSQFLDSCSVVGKYTLTHTHTHTHTASEYSKSQACLLPNATIDPFESLILDWLLES